jgi:hypothetical protein
MQGFWMTFTDGAKGYCEGQSPYDAVQGVIAKVRKEAFEEAALTVEARGIRIGGAVQPKKAANEIRALKTEVK